MSNHRAEPANSTEDDIPESERRLIQKELFFLEDQKEAAEHRYRVMFENALVGLFRVDVKKRRLVAANNEAARSFGFTVVEELIRWVNASKEHFAPFKSMPYPSRFDTREPHSFSTRMPRKDGSEFWAQFSLRYSEGGRFIEGAIKDITDQVESMERLRRAKAEAEEANAAKSRFLATISHEIRTPLNGIVGFAEILTGENRKGNDYAVKILDESDRLMLLIDQLLDISRLEANKVVLESILFDLHQVLDEAEEALLENLGRKGLTYGREVGDDVPRWFLGDPMRLRQVLSNLLSNSVKFTEQGSVVLSVTLASSLEEKPRITFSVRDTGIGIPEDQQERIFASFEQADTSISRKYGGSGLGVSICRELVSLMGGELRVSSRVGIGSDFHFTVPMTLPPENLDGVPARMEGHLSRLDSLDGVQVLLVEDYETNREIARHHLENAGCLVAHVENGRDALVYLDEGKPADLIFMDLHMPVMDGLGATEGIRRRGILTPIIGMTASAYAEDRLRCLSAGMDDFLTKPLRRADLLAKAVDWVAASSLGLSSPADSSFQDADFPATPSLPSSGSRDQVSEGGNVLVPAPAVLRYTDLLGEFDGEKDVVAELIDGFCEDVPSRFERAQKAFDDRDAESLHREAHSIKGGAMNLMADEMAEVALRLEKRAKATGSVVDEGLREGVKTALEELASAFERFREARCRMQENHETDQR